VKAPSYSVLDGGSGFDVGVVVGVVLSVVVGPVENVWIDVVTDGKGLV